MLRKSNVSGPCLNQSANSPLMKTRLALLKLVVLFLVLFCTAATPVCSHAKTVLDDGLEGAVYLEETVGDLDKAIEAYKKVIQASKKQIAVAAEAQFRLGKCYAQKGMAAKAEAAFEAVVDNYPKQEKWVNLAKSQLGAELTLLPIPWGDGDELQLEMTLPNGRQVGCQLYRIQKSMHNGQPAWECDAWQTVTLNNQKGKSHVLVDGESFTSINSRWRHSLLGEAEAVFEDSKATVTMKGKDEPRVLKFNETVYDNEQAAEVFRRLDMKVGFKGKITVVSSLGMTKQVIGLEVPRMKTIKSPLGEFECFEVELDLGQTFYISNDANRYIVQFLAGGVEATLTKVRKAEEFGKPQTIETDRFTLTLPDRWHAFTQANSKHKEEARTWLIDPENKMSVWIEAGSKKSVKKHHGYDSPKTWLQSNLDKAEDQFDGVTLDPAGIVQAKIGQHDGLATKYEYKEKDQAMVVERKSAFGSSAAISIGLVYSKDDGQDSKTEVEDIIASLKLK